MRESDKKSEQRSELVRHLADQLRNGWVGLAVGEAAAAELERLEDAVNLLGRAALSHEAPTDMVPLGTISQCPSCDGDGKLTTTPGQHGPCWRCGGSGRVMAYSETLEQFAGRMKKVEAFVTDCQIPPVGPAAGTGDRPHPCDAPLSPTAATISQDIQEWLWHLDLHLTEHDERHAGLALRAAWPHVRDYLASIRGTLIQLQNRAAPSAIESPSSTLKCAKCCFGCSEAEILKCKTSSPERWPSAASDGTAKGA